MDLQTLQINPLWNLDYKQSWQSEETQGTCCWKAKGEDNPLSAYVRSVPFSQVLGYYKTMQELDPKLTLVDISDWKTGETTILKKLGVKCLNPREMGIQGLIQTCRNKKIITIDTALAHLCAVMGTNATLLLNYIPDERWKELHQFGNCYGKYLTILQQTQFCNWEDTLSSLITCSST